MLRKNLEYPPNTVPPSQAVPQMVRAYHRQCHILLSIYLSMTAPKSSLGCTPAGSVTVAEVSKPQNQPSGGEGHKDEVQPPKPLDVLTAVSGPAE